MVRSESSSLSKKIIPCFRKKQSKTASLPQKMIETLCLIQAISIYMVRYIIKNMLSPSDLRKEIERRLRSYLSRDKSGIRKALLRLLIRSKSLTVLQIHESLSAKFDVTYHSVASMVGIVASKLGILSTHKTKDGALGVYELKEQYAQLVEQVVASA